MISKTKTKPKKNQRKTHEIITGINRRSNGGKRPSLCNSALRGSAPRAIDRFRHELQTSTSFPPSDSRYFPIHFHPVLEPRFKSDLPPRVGPYSAGRSEPIDGHSQPRLQSAHSFHHFFFCWFFFF